MGKTESVWQISKNPDNNSDRNSNVVNINASEGDYTIFYCTHLSYQDPNLIPKTVNGIVLENVEDATNWKAAMPSYVDYLKSIDTYKLLFPKLEERKIPIFSADVGSMQAGLMVLADSALIFAEAVAAGAIAQRVINSDLSRRSLLKGAALGLAAYLSLPAASLFSEGLSQVTSVGEDQAFELTKISSASHPEYAFFAAQMRNTIIAAKEKLILLELGEKPHLATVIGQGHVDIENRIQDSLDSNLEYLKKVKPFLRVFNYESLYTSYRFDFDGVRWLPSEIYEFPKLKEAVT